MNLREAYNVLGLDIGSSDEDVKKKSRELMKKFHPDVNKEPAAEENFKRVNEAVNTIKNKSEQSVNFSSQPTDWESIFETVFSSSVPYNKVRRGIDINLTLSLTFEEAVLGVNKQVKFFARVECQTCKGVGVIPAPNACTNCRGTGVVKNTTVKGMMSFTINARCEKCNGASNMERCHACNGELSFMSEVEKHVTIPPGVYDGCKLKIKSSGNFVSFNSPKADVIFHVRVAPSKHGFTLDDYDVVLQKEISLLDALKGTKLTVPTILGSSEVTVPQKTRHGDEIIIKGLGVKGKGNMRIKMLVLYPEDVSNIIHALNL